MVVKYCVKWVHCQHGMARPRVADSGDGLQIWRVKKGKAVPLHAMEALGGEEV
jgi:hypothetical protein